MKTNLDSFYKTNDSLEKNGVWFEISESTAFLVKRFNAGNPTAKAAVAKHFKPFAKQMELGTLSDDKMLEVQVKVFVNSCLVDWKGVEIDGVDTAFSPEIAVKFLIALPDLFTTLWTYSTDFSNYKEILDVGNS